MRSVLLLLAALAITPAAAQQAADYELSCEGADRDCKASLTQFRTWFPKAMRGDYQGQRNIAFCLSTGCDGAVRPRPLTACAWRLVIVSTGSKHVDQGDTANLKNDCGKLDETDRRAAAAQSVALLARMQRR